MPHGVDGGTDDTVINREQGTAVILSTHDMDDIEHIWDRIIMINQGSLLYDGSVSGLKPQFGTGSRIVVEFAEHDADVSGPRLNVVRKIASLR